MEWWISFLAAAIVAGTPLLFATLGGILSERVGNMNLGIEGMMIMGAAVGFKVALTTQNALLAMAGAALAGAAGALIYAVLTIFFRANQVVTGLTLTIFGTGFANFFGEMMIRNTPGGQPSCRPALLNLLAERPLLGDLQIPVLSKLLSTNPLVYLAIILAIVCSFYISRTRTGLKMRSVGETRAAGAAGVNVSLMKYATFWPEAASPAWAAPTSP